MLGYLRHFVIKEVRTNCTRTFKGFKGSWKFKSLDWDGNLNDLGKELEIWHKWKLLSIKV